MVEALEGILVGLLLSVFIGATFFILIETSINKGFKAALVMNMGVFLSDVSIILLAYFSSIDFIKDLLENNLFKLGGGLVFIGFGNYYVFKKYQLKHIDTSKNFKNTRLFFNGFFVNTFNPSVIAFWLGTLVLVLANKHFDSSQVYIFFVSCLSVIIIIDILKIYFASKLKGFINEKIMKFISLATGVLLILLGLRIVYSTWF